MNGHCGRWAASEARYCGFWGCTTTRRFGVGPCPNVESSIERGREMHVGDRPVKTGSLRKGTLRTTSDLDGIEIERARREQQRTEHRRQCADRAPKPIILCPSLAKRVHGSRDVTSA